MRFTFQPSKIWEGSSDRIDEKLAPVTVKIQKDDVHRAMSKLPSLGAGREWILVKKEP